MISISDNNYDEKYFEKMSFDELNNFIKSFKTYEDFLKKEKIPYIPEKTFSNWKNTIYFMDINIDNVKYFIHKYISSSINLEGNKYTENDIKEIIKNYQNYKTEEYNRIYKEFKDLTADFNSQ
jgi:hypothetical protein